MEDIKLIIDQKNFKYRVNGIIIHGGKVLALRRSDGAYSLPGGHVRIGEDSNEAIIREMLEETKTHVSIIKELAIIEFFYVDRNNSETHEVSFYYLVEPKKYDKIKSSKISIIDLDNGKVKKHNLEWLSIKELNKIDFRPDYIKSKLIQGDHIFEHKIIKKAKIF